ncbi:hypothetical protein FB566_2096 [Stackebrandtia endophytica]|uniref:YCII-related domain-containing protein n=1 Tax=Stackebrandtia endophytica TaxID=1496996 RepID=A0A543AVH5_9ACTN|nr:YciI family protein [Stackebrandtia endophytica]TQL76564.1 hypothetical protein FB566_2096 [Stackebrandtia endophytica]
MKYMLMMTGTTEDYEAMDAWTKEEIRAHVQFMTEVNERLAASDAFVTAEGLASPRDAKIVRAAGDGSPTVSGGPFPDDKEFLAGFWIIETDTFDQVADIAAMISTAPGRGGKPLNIPIQVREVGEAPDV